MKVMMNVIGFMCILVIVISCLGILGMADNSSRIRRRAIGIGKICSAGKWYLVILLSRRFAAMRMIAARINKTFDMESFFMRLNEVSLLILQYKDQLWLAGFRLEISQPSRFG